MNKIITATLISENISEELYYVTLIDGAACKMLKSFLDEIGKAFKFPSYYGNNLSALRECLNDLSWIGKPNYLLIVKNSKEFLSKESEEIRNYIFSCLEEVAKEWANVPEDEAKEPHRKRADFRIKLI